MRGTASSSTGFSLWIFVRAWLERGFACTFNLGGTYERPQAEACAT